MGNHALDTNPPVLNGVVADIHITRRGSDWYFTVFSIFGLATLVFLFFGFRRAATDRVFHYITTAVMLVTAIAYFTMASDLGFVPINVEWHRSRHTVSGNKRQIFYVRYIDWFISTPLLLTGLLLTAAIPFSHIGFILLLDLIMISSLLAGALISTTYKWGYFTFSLAIFLYIAYTIIVPGRRHASALGTDVTRAFHSCGIYLLFFWTLYPICWGVSEGGNVIAPDSEAIFYGVLDILGRIGFCALLIWGHRDIDPARLGVRLRAYDDAIPGVSHTGHIEKNGQRQAAANV